MQEPQKDTSSRINMQDGEPEAPPSYPDFDSMLQQHLSRQKQDDDDGTARGLSQA